MHRSVSPDQEGLQQAFHQTEIVQNILKLSSRPWKNMQERNKLKIVYPRIESFGLAVLYANIVSFPLAVPVPRWNCTVTSLVQITVPAVPTYCMQSTVPSMI